MWTEDEASYLKHLLVMASNLQVELDEFDPYPDSEDDSEALRDARYLAHKATVKVLRLARSADKAIREQA